MGKRGPKPKDVVATVPLQGIPKPPKGLDAEAKKHWLQVAGLLNESGFGSALDADALLFYVTLWSRWRKAEDELAKPPATLPGGEGGGEVITTVNRYRQLNPWYTVAKESLKDLKSYLSEFGLSPKARAKLVLPEVEEVDSKWEDFDDG
jgi:P27 family predicted phage terminase small subunit